MEAHDHGDLCGLRTLVGLRHPSTPVISAHGVYIASREVGDEFFRVLTVFEGARIASHSSIADVDRQVMDLLERDWVWMTAYDVLTLLSPPMGVVGDVDGMDLD